MNNSQDRKPAVAGQFYPSNAEELKSDVEIYLNKAKGRKENTLAVVSPHAGYVFSGQVAANAIAQINPNNRYDNVFVIGISHQKAIEGASVYNLGNYIFPGATIEVNVQLANELIHSNKNFICDKAAHVFEHSVEVQLPFLYYHLKHQFKLVPILIGTNDLTVLEDISETLKPYFNERNVFVFSSDFSHYPSYENAIDNDNRTAQALISNNIENFVNILSQNNKKNIPGLATSACGSSDLIVLLNLTKNNNNIKYEIIDYKNSGDSSYGGKERVVGYFALSVRKSNSFELSFDEKHKLIEIARSTVTEYLNSGKVQKIDISSLTDNLKKEIGAFVTLTKNAKLRGCIGRFMPNQALWSVVQDMAIAAATEDSRFSPLTADELDNINIEISVLTPLQKVKTIDEIEIGRDGIYIKKNFNSGTLLPQVASDNNWDKLQFLEYCSQHKAGIGKDGWKDAELFIYQAIVFHE